MTVLASGVGISGPTASAATAPSYRRDFPDPFIVNIDGRYQAYATQSGGFNIQTMSSVDLTNWDPVTDALPSLPGWAARGATWAPAVMKRGERWLLYYTVRQRSSRRQCISTALADRPEGPFVDSSPGPLICQLERGGSIDPNPFVDTSGRAFLYWKSDDNALGRPTSLWGQELTPDGLSLVGPVLQVEQDRPWESPLIEGPSMVMDAGTYYLFYGGNWWESASAAIGYAVCDTPLGPCAKDTTAEPWLSSSGAATGPSGPAFFADASGALWLAYHAWAPSQVGYAAGGARSLWMDRVRFTGGRPVIAEATPATSATRAATGLWGPRSGRSPAMP